MNLLGLTPSRYSFNRYLLAIFLSIYSKGSSPTKPFYANQVKRRRKTQLTSMVRNLQWFEELDVLKSGMWATSTHPNTPRAHYWLCCDDVDHLLPTAKNVLVDVIVTYEMNHNLHFDDDEEREAFFNEQTE